MAIRKPGNRKAPSAKQHTRVVTIESAEPKPSSSRGMLSQRFKQLHKTKTAKTPKVGSPSKRQNANVSKKFSEKMDIDSEKLSKAAGSKRTRGQKPRRGRRGGARGGRQSRGKSLNPDSLDKDLAKYMLKDKQHGTALLDADLDSYMMEVESTPNKNVTK